MNMRRIDSLLEKIDHRTGGLLRIIKLAVERFNEGEVPEAAASIAYYAFFSLFPLLLVLISIGSFALESETVQEEIFQVIFEIVPVPADFIQTAIEQVLAQRGAVGVVGLIGLLWSASSAFTVLVKHINQAWPKASSRRPLIRRVLGLGMTLILVVLFALWFASNTVLDMAPRFVVSYGVSADIFNTFGWRLLASFVPFLIIVFLFMGLYWRVPNQSVRWTSALWGALVAALGWELAATIFNWYVSSDLARFTLVYGSLGAIVAFMIWIYISGLIALFGAYLTAAIERDRSADQIATL
jgi:membrane protein